MGDICLPCKGELPCQGEIDALVFLSQHKTASSDPFLDGWHTTIPRVINNHVLIVHRRGLLHTRRPRHNDFREGKLTPGSIAGELASSQRRIVHPIRHDPPRTRRSARRHVSTLYVGLDVHQESSAVAYAPEERAAEVVFLGPIGTRPCDLDPRVRPLTSNATQLVFVDAAGPCGSWLSRDLTKQPLRGWVVAPARVPKQAGDRVNTDRRDATQRARLMRSGALTPV